MIFTLLFSLSVLSKLQIDECQIRLPFRVPGSPTKPFCIQTASMPGVSFEILNPDVAAVGETRTVGSQTIVKIMVEHTGPDQAATILIAKCKDETLHIPVYVDKIDRIEIRSILDVLYVNSFCMFKLFAYNANGLYFNSLDGVDVDWFPQSKEEESTFSFANVANSPFKTESNTLPKSTIIIHPLEVAKVVLKAKLTDVGDVKPANRPLQFVLPIIFNPTFYCLYPGTYAQLVLYNAKIDENNVPAFDSEEKKIDISNEGYTVYSSNSKIVTTDSNALILAKEPGLTDVRARDKVMILSEASATIRVALPNKGIWPDQWIKVRPEKPEKVNTGPYEPDMSTITLYYDNSMITTPDSLPWILSGDDYTKIGKNSVIATLDECKFNVKGTVFTCRKPQFGEEKKIKKVRIPLSHNGYPVKVFYGSGFFTWSVEDESVISLTKDHTIITHKIGKTSIIVEDQKLPGYKAKLKVTIQKLKNLDFKVNRNELYVGDKVNYEFTATYIDHVGQLKKFDYVMPNNVEITDESIINKDLKGLKQGFTQIRISIGNDRSDFVQMNVFNKLWVQSVIHGTSHKWLNLQRNDGPVKWPGNGQSNKLVCGSANPELNSDFKEMKFLEDYDGECVLSVQNEKTPENPNPILAEVKFRVVSTAIVEIGLYVTDKKSIDKNKCQFVNSRIVDLNQIPPRKVTVPINHKIETVLYAFAKDGKNLGVFNAQSIKYDITFDNGDKQDISQPLIVKDNLTITVTEPNLPEFKLRVNAVKPHFVDQNELPIVLYHKDPNQHVVDILDGSGFFIPKGVKVNIDGRNLKISPSTEPSRTIIISDECIPDNDYKIDVETEKIHSLIIKGPDYAIVGQELTFNTLLYGASNKKITSKSAAMIHWTHSPANLGNVKDDEWRIVATKSGKLDIGISADDVHQSHRVTVFDEMSFPESEIRIFVDDLYPLRVYGGPEKGIEFISSDNSIVEVLNNGAAHALKPGHITVTAAVPGHPNMGSATMKIHVIDVRELVIEQSVSKMYVGSYVHLQPFLITDIGKIPATQVAWKVGENDHWEKLYDSSLMILGQKEGVVTVTAVTPQKMHAEKVLQFDYKLVIKSPTELNLPIGSSSTIEIENGLKVDYKIVTLNDGGKSASSIVIEEGGVVKANDVGRYIIVVDYNQQWATIKLTVSRPPKLYLQSISSSKVHEHLLDAYGQKYDHYNDVNFDYNVTFDATKEDDNGHIKSFNVPTSVTDPVYAMCTAHGSRFNEPVSHVALLFPRTLIFPQSPILVKGATLQFVCHAEKPQWSSSNDRVVSISPQGVVNALKPGKTTISCSTDIKTSVTVTTLDNINVEAESIFSYNIVPQISGSFTTTTSSSSSTSSSSTSTSTSSIIPPTISLPNDIAYKCEWSAKECGRAILDHTNSLKPVCKLEMFTPRLCPAHSTLKIEADSVVGNVHLEKSVDVNLKTNVFGLPSTLVEYITDKNPVVEKVIKPTQDEVIVKEAPGFDVSITKEEKEHKLRISPNEHFKGQGNVLLEHKVTGEMIRITVIKESFGWYTIFGGNLSIGLFVILLCIILLMYVTYQVGKGGLLVPVSPQRHHKSQ